MSETKGNGEQEQERSRMPSKAQHTTAVLLYRNILRAHKRFLPNEMKGLGDSYVKSEFKLFKKVTDEQQLKQFYVEWNTYLNQLQQTARAKEMISAGSLDYNDSSTNKAATIASSTSSSSNNTVASMFGKNLPADIELTEEQMAQLQKLREETNKAGDLPDH